MNIKNVFYTENNQIRVLWRILIFISLLILAISPLTLIDNSYAQLFIAVLILIFGIYLNSKFLDKKDFSSYGLIIQKETLVYLIVGLLFGFLSVVLMLVLGKTIGVIRINSFLLVPKPWLLCLFGFKMFLVSIWEELFFRGYLFTNLRDGLKFKIISKKQALLISLLLSSILFGLAHFNNNNASIISMTLLTINGIVWCIPFVITKNLGLSTGLHAAWNFSQTLFGFTMSGNKSINSLLSIENIGSDLFTGGDYGPESGLLGLIGFVIMLLISLTYLKIKKHKITL
ncbi:CPBP family intramembrane glutamic endopeptidase [Aquimarina gracilis]|uniref:CPBP family intramembrane glutamic endopeptidase n=1 Tax=Aquimarina gracilis TaxID=874422 RepID=A0ABU5ZPQ8_9FLAO|nr:CPBP family intramembrane glutamic endopeptidase [Aquimarina gracilis]MEB3344096.1 CPBP family intramembrane glutamic endopeptidase [Aquimarina gracilis]